MALGPRIRGVLGPLERPVATLYRRIFFDLDRFARTVHRWIPEADRILEVGCGEGQLLTCLQGLYPRSRFLGIDISDAVGRLFSGDSARVEFRRQELAELADQEPASWDLVILCDVLHHVPWPQHKALLGNVARVLAPEGHFVVKDWERRPTPIHLLGYLSDRWITGDRIRYMNERELEQRLEAVFGSRAIRGKKRIPPWANNLTFLVQSGAQRSAAFGGESQ